MSPQPPTTTFTRAWAEIDLDALARNISELRIIFGNRSLLLPVKANAYGHGAVEIARTVADDDDGAAYLGVVDAGEGIELREAGIERPVLLMSSLLDEEVEPALENDLDIIVSPFEILESIITAAACLEKRARIHLMVDTGLSRYGISPDEALEAARRAASDDKLELVGLATHFVSSESDDISLAEIQLERFMKVIAAFESEDLLPPLIHAANSGAVLGLPDAHFNMVRPGLAVYGAYPAEKFGSEIHLEPVMSVRAKITQVREVEPGATAGYGATWTASQRTRLALVPVGYADGWPTSLFGRAEVLIRGKRFQIAGRVAMDCMMVDVGRTAVEPGETVTLLGRDGGSCIHMEELGQLSGRIPYEVTCGIGQRVHRTYMRPSCTPSANSSSKSAKASSQVSSLAP